MKERIIKDIDNMGMRCCYAVQVLKGKKWQYKETYNAKGFNPHMPRWYNTHKEAESHLDPNAEICKDVTLGVDDNMVVDINKSDNSSENEYYNTVKEIYKDIQKIRNKTELLSNPLYNDAGGSTFWKQIDEAIEKSSKLVLEEKRRVHELMRKNTKDDKS